MAKRYGQRPSSLLPRGTLRSPLEKLSFDVNVALRGGYAEIVAQKEASEKIINKGQVTNRQQALAVIHKARADVIEMEEEREKRRMRE